MSLRLLRLLALAALPISVPTPIFASAWLQPAGHGQIITTASYYRAETFYDENGFVVSKDPYSKYELNPYLEYGLNEDWTIGANLLLDYASVTRTPFGASGNYFVAEGEFFARRQLYKDNTRVFSLQPLVKLPSFYFDKSHNTQSATGSGDVEIAAQYGQSFTLLGTKHFVDAGLGYRLRSGNPRDQYRASFTLGQELNERWMLLAQTYATIATDIPNGARITQRSDDDYDLIRAQSSIVYKIDDDTSVQVGVFHHAYVRNTGAGNGALASLWLDF